MSPDDLNRHQIERLAFIRYLFTLGVQHAQGAGPQSSVAILLFHDAVELFLVLASEALHVKRADSFMNYFQPLDEKLKPGPPMPERESMRRLNDARNALKHKGLRADRADLEHHTEAVIRFFEEATPRIFGADIDSVSLVAVVRCEGAQPYCRPPNWPMESTERQTDRVHARRHSMKFYAITNNVRATAGWNRRFPRGTA